MKSFEFQDFAKIKVEAIKSKVLYANEPVRVVATVISSDYGHLKAKQKLDFVVLRKHILAPEVMSPGIYYVDVQKRASMEYEDQHGNMKQYAHELVFKRLTCEEWYNQEIGVTKRMHDSLLMKLIDMSSSSKSRRLDRI